MEKCLYWDDEIETWSDTLFTWSDCIIIDELIPPSGNGGISDIWPLWATGNLDKLNDTDKKKKKRLITLITYIKENKIIEEKEIKDMTISIEDVKMVKKELNKFIKFKK